MSKNRIDTINCEDEFGNMGRTWRTDIIEFSFDDMENYANQRIIEELEKVKGKSSLYIDTRIKELKQF